MTVNFYEKLFTFLLIFRSILVRMRNVSEKFVEKIKTAFYFPQPFFTPKIAFNDINKKKL